MGISPGVFYFRASLVFSRYSPQGVMSRLTSGSSFFGKDQRSAHHADFAGREKWDGNDEHANVDHDDYSLADLKSLHKSLFFFSPYFGVNSKYVSSP